MNEVLVFFKDDALGLDDAFQALVGRGLTCTHQDANFSARWNEGPIFQISLTREPKAQSRAIKLAKGTPYKSQLEHCDAFYAVAIDDLEEALDEINTLIEVQCTLQDLTQGFIYVSWNQSILPPE